MAAPAVGQASVLEEGDTLSIPPLRPIGRPLLAGLLLVAWWGTTAAMGQE